MSAGVRKFLNKQARMTVMGIILIFYVAALIIEAAPPSAFTDAASRLINSRLNYLGIFENYGVYAPDPARYNQSLRAVIEFQDGSKKNWDFPDPSRMSCDDLTRQIKEKWVELEYYLCWDARNIHLLVPDAARYLAWLNRDRGNPPVKVTIYREKRPIVAPGLEEKDECARGIENQVLVTYLVRAEDLE